MVEAMGAFGSELFNLATPILAEQKHLETAAG